MGNTENYPYAVTGNAKCHGRQAEFYVNMHNKACSTLSPLNYIDGVPRKVRLKIGSPLLNCLYPRRHSLVPSVSLITLSELIKKRDIRHIAFLKIDAQGEDLSIVKNVFDGHNSYSDVN